MRIKRKFVELDANGNGVLEGDELGELARWALSSFKPDGKTQPQDAEVHALAAKLQAHGALNFDEFHVYLAQVTADAADAARLERAQAEQRRAEAERHHERALRAARVGRRRRVEEGRVVRYQPGGALALVGREQPF